MEWMSPMDASFLHIEGPNNPMHIGGVSIFEGPAPPFERLEEMVGSKLDAVPRYRQKVRFVPLGIGRPVWVDDPHFSLTYHLRHSALPAPGTEDILRRTAARIFAHHLDRQKPLWEIWMLEGLSDNRWALLSKVHHCMVDGVSATDLMTVMFDDVPAGGPSRVWEPGPEPGDLELVVRTVTHQLLNPSEAATGRCGPPPGGPERRSPRPGRRSGPWPRRPDCCARSDRPRSPVRWVRTGPGAVPTCR